MADFYTEFLTEVHDQSYNSQGLRRVCDKFDKPYNVVRKALKQANEKFLVQVDRSAEVRAAIIIEQLKKHRL